MIVMNMKLCMLCEFVGGGGGVLEVQINGHNPEVLRHYQVRKCLIQQIIHTKFLGVYVHHVVTYCHLRFHSCN
jgi:hypothetical protein